MGISFGMYPMSRVFTLVLWQHSGESVVQACWLDMRELRPKGEMNVERCRSEGWRVRYL